MHPKSVLIISDMYGLKSEYGRDDNYIFATADVFEKLGFVVKIYSSLKLAKISAENNIKNIHKLFVSFGIKNAIESLGSEKDSFDIGIGFSIGGTILWKSCQEKKLSLQKLICISSTRLRRETKKINIPTITLFGEKDHYAPSLEQMNDLGAICKIIPEFDHDFYRNPKFIAQIFEICVI
ncbi:MAG: hypothetical protein JSR33_03035 [Proteobacteria bacterium]|nr:hypothetical protein [Pseudomonadota bacterium]